MSYNNTVKLEHLKYIDAWINHRKIYDLHPNQNNLKKINDLQQQYEKLAFEFEYDFQKVGINIFDYFSIIIEIWERTSIKDERLRGALITGPIEDALCYSELECRFLDYCEKNRDFAKNIIDYTYWKNTETYCKIVDKFG
jgi:hypothetical protein